MVRYVFRLYKKANNEAFLEHHTVRAEGFPCRWTCPSFRVCLRAAKICDVIGLVRHAFSNTAMRGRCFRCPSPPFRACMRLDHVVSSVSFSTVFLDTSQRAEGVVGLNSLSRFAFCMPLNDAMYSVFLGQKHYTSPNTTIQRGRRGGHLLNFTSACMCVCGWMMPCHRFRSEQSFRTPVQRGRGRLPILISVVSCLHAAG